jgi:uncharacterized protein YqgC (DUF456 family)
MHTTILIIASLLVAAGIPLAFVPMLPALSYMFVVALLFGIYDGLVALTAENLIVLAALVAASVIVDNSAGLLGAKYGGAHGKSLLWGMLGAIIGTFAFPIFGSLVGLFIAVLSAEVYYKKTNRQAVKAASGALLGAAAGIAVNVVLGIAFLATFIVFALS